MKKQAWTLISTVKNRYYIHEARKREKERFDAIRAYRTQKMSERRNLCERMAVRSCLLEVMQLEASVKTIRLDGWVGVLAPGLFVNRDQR